MKDNFDIKEKHKAIDQNYKIIENPVKLILAHNSIMNGYGRCRSCNCSGYISKHDGTHTCKVCGHHYDRHSD